MLILSRRPGQGIRIGDAVRVTVVAIDGQFVRLGFEAPASYKILREELWNSVATANKEALATGTLAQTFAQVIQHGPDAPSPTAPDLPPATGTTTPRS